MEIRDGSDENAEILTTETGLNMVSLPPAVQSTSNNVFVKFTSDSWEQREGFELVYYPTPQTSMYYIANKQGNIC